jgi:hypothetical protein
MMKIAILESSWSRLVGARGAHSTFFHVLRRHASLPTRDPGHGSLGRWQDRLRRPWGWVAGGCHPNRDTPATLAAAGFDVDGLEPAELPAAPPIVRPAIGGSAAPPGG